MAGRAEEDGVGADRSAGREGASLSTSTRRTLLQQGREAQNIARDPEEGALGGGTLIPALREGRPRHASLPPSTLAFCRRARADRLRMLASRSNPLPPPHAPG
eukprot:14510499-Heterocapsa_arctica.AAC.1